MYHRTPTANTPYISLDVLWSAPFFVAAGAAVLPSTIGDVEAASFGQDLSVLNRHDVGLPNPYSTGRALLSGIAYLKPDAAPCKDMRKPRCDTGAPQRSPFITSPGRENSGPG
jgi:hypothetical protein